MFLADEDHSRDIEDLAWVAVFMSVVGGFIVLVGLRNVGLWLLGLTGTRAEGVVERIEVSNGPLESTRRPVVSFTTREGHRVTARPALYRKRCKLATGQRVEVSYLGRNPQRMVIHGYDFRLREPATSVAGVLVTVGAIWWYLHL
ncbi:MAG TPA: DUF3592 domain-containing protein [Micromonosporaceae bacterium]|nr:DUF3592 domain-containing protein [Micromonosporaceae bacterium]